MNQFVKRVGEKRYNVISFPHLVEKPVVQEHKYIRLCFSYDILNAVYHLRSLFVSMKICISVSVTDVVLTLLVPSESVMSRVVTIGKVRHNSRMESSLVCT